MTESPNGILKITVTCEGDFAGANPKKVRKLANGLRGLANDLENGKVLKSPARFTERRDVKARADRSQPR